MSWGATAPLHRVSPRPRGWTRLGGGALRKVDCSPAIAGTYSLGALDIPLVV
jgi:hypothetical protein